MNVYTKVIINFKYKMSKFKYTNFTINEHQTVFYKPLHSFPAVKLFITIIDSFDREIKQRRNTLFVKKI